MKTKDKEEGIRNSDSNTKVGSSNSIQIEDIPTRDSNPFVPLLDYDLCPRVKPLLQSNITKPIFIIYSRHVKRKTTYKDP